MKLVPILTLICAVSILPATAQDVAKPAGCVLKLRVEQDGKTTFAQEIQLQSQGTFDVNTAVGGANFEARGSDDLQQDRMVVHLNFDFSRETDATNVHAAKSCVSTTLAEQPNGKEVKIGWLMSRTNDVAHEDAVWASVRKAG